MEVVKTCDAAIGIDTAPEGSTAKSVCHACTHTWRPFGEEDGDDWAAAGYDRLSRQPGHAPAKEPCRTSNTLRQCLAYCSEEARWSSGLQGPPTAVQAQVDERLAGDAGFAAPES